MKILMRSTVFKTAALAGLFSCVLALGGVFPGVTVSAHADHPVTAGDVGTDEAKLKQFVESAIDEYYIEYLIKGEDTTCNLDDIKDRLPPELKAKFSSNLQAIGLPVTDLTPDSVRKLTADQIRDLIKLYNSAIVRPLLPDDFDMWEECEPLPGTDSLRTAFGSEEGDWRKDSVYLFVLHYNDGGDPPKAIVYHGLGTEIENKDMTNLTGAGGKKIMPLLLAASQGPGEGREKGYADYCWDDPATMDDDLPDDGEILTANGDSWKTSYVVDPFEYLGADPPAGSPTVLFGSGIYPKTETANKPAECKIYGEEEPPTTPATPATPTTGGSGGGGCAIAAGSVGTPLGVAFNLLLAASALVLTVSFASRITGGRNGNRS